MLPLAAGALALDQLAKLAVVAWLPEGASFPATGFFRFTHVTNTGSAFSMFADQSFALAVASFLVIGVLLLAFGNMACRNAYVRLSLGLQLGGAAGNLLDRLTRGAVVDFVDVGPWPIFNIADSAIVIGLAVMLAVFALDRPNERYVKRTGPPPEWHPGNAPDPGS
jgi:signal peptidase II